MNKRSRSLAMLLAALLLPPHLFATNHHIDISGLAFTPLKTHVNYGDTVTWTNQDAVSHTATSAAGSPKTFNSGILAPGQSFSVVINPSDTRGPFPYFCSIHVTMKDTIFVSTNHSIKIVNFDFQPRGLIVNRGDTVTWENQDVIPHTSTSQPSSPKSWDSGLLSQGGTFSVIFTTGDGLGPFPYLCSVHTEMVDTLRVNPIYCCQGTTGNVNMAGIVDLSDLSLLIAYLTATPKPALPCATEANVNSAGIIDLSDLSLLIAYLTATSKPTLPNCPS